MTDHEVSSLRAHLDAKRTQLSDPLANARQVARRTPLHLGWMAGSAAAAVLIFAVGVTALPLLNPTPSPEWAAILDDLWVADSTTEDPLLSEDPLEQWNLLDLGVDQGI